MTDIQDRTDRRDRTAGDAVSLLQVRDLRVAVMLRSGREDAVRGVNLTLHRGETLAIVGESGSGKSLTALAIAGLLPRGVDARGAVEFNGTNLLDLSPRAMRGVRAKEIGFVFQDPLAALNPTMTVGAQVGEARRGRFAGESRRDRRGAPLTTFTASTCTAVRTFLHAGTRPVTIARRSTPVAPERRDRLGRADVAGTAGIRPPRQPARGGRAQRRPSGPPPRSVPRSG